MNHAEPAAETTRPGGIRHWTLAATIFVLSQLLFWSLLFLGERAVLPRDAKYAASIEMRALAADGETATVDVVEVPLHPAPAYVHAAPTGTRHAVFQYAFDHPGNPAATALYMSWSRRVSEVRLNGTVLSARAPLDIWSVLGGFDPMLYDLPEELLQERNQLEFEVFGSANKILPVFFVGDLDALFAAYAWAQMINVDLVVAAIGVMLFVALICAISPWSETDRSRVRALMLLLLLWSLRNLSFFGIDAEIPAPWRQISHYQLTFAFLLSLAWFGAAWTGRTLIGWRWYAGAWLLLALFAVVVGALGGNVAVFHWLFPIETWLSFAMVGAAIWQICRYAANGSWARRYESLLLLICFSAVGIDALDDRYDLTIPFLSQWPLTFYAAPVCGLLLGLASCTILVSQSQRARRMLESINELLDSRLKAQELALAAGHQREQAAAQERAVMDERQRLMRDMHDGLGGQLVALSARLRGGLGTRQDAAEEVERALDDLRLIVTSLDRADENIGVAFGAFRERLQPRLADPDLELLWEIDPAAAAHHLSVERVLNLLRILSEACANALKHAQGSQLRVSIQQLSVSQLCAEVSDNGVGFQTIAGGGKGLANMGIRARQLGGEIDINSDQGGTCVRVTFPISVSA